MVTELQTRNFTSELQRTFDRMRTDLDRVELLAVAMAEFAGPVPDYEPRFHHIGHVSLRAHELTSAQD